MASTSSFASTPGVYEVTASLVGYRAVTQRDVAVSIDRTTPLNFSLGETTAELAEITVTAERPPVEMDVSYTQVIMSAKEIEAPPVGPRLRDAFATQVGVDTDSWVFEYPRWQRDRDRLYG